MRSQQHLIKEITKVKIDGWIYGKFIIAQSADVIVLSPGDDASRSQHEPEPSSDQAERCLNSKEAKVASFLAS